MARIGKKLGWTVGCVALASVWATAANVGNRPVYGDEPTAANGRKAFLVGAGDYAEAPDLRFVEKEVETLAARFVEIGFDKKNVATLKTGGDFGDYPTKATIERRFNEFVDNLRTGDFVVLYLSGHGMQAGESKERFFAPIDASTSDPLRTSISIDKMAKALEESDASFCWTIVDACRGDATQGTGDAKEATLDSVDSKSNVDNALEINSALSEKVALLLSCPSGEKGGADEEGGFFARSLLEALDFKNGKTDANRDGEATFLEICEYVTRRTNELAKERRGVSQTPVLSGAFINFTVGVSTK